MLSGRKTEKKAYEETGGDVLEARQRTRYKSYMVYACRGMIPQRMIECRGRLVVGSMGKAWKHTETRQM